MKIDKYDINWENDGDYIEDSEGHRAGVVSGRTI